MRYGKFLQKNGTIGFVAPSFGCNIEPYRTGFDSAQRKFRDLGHGIWIGENCYEGCGIGISNTPEKCGKELTEAYLSGENDILISCGGGELMCEILDYVDFEKIKAAQPKWYMGYSDNTNMTFLLTTICDTAAVYGPCAPAFGMDSWHPAIQDAYEVLRGEKSTITGYEKWEKESLKDENHPNEPYHVTEEKILHSYLGTKEIQNVQMSGRLIGGCMDCLVNLTGTKYDHVKTFSEKYKDDGFIWFLESCDLNVMAIRRAIWQMEHAGWFSHVKGFLIGRPLVFGQEMIGLDQYHAVIDLLGKYHVPIVMDADIGHLPPMMPLVSGSMAEITVSDNDMEVHMEMR